MPEKTNTLLETMAGDAEVLRETLLDLDRAREKAEALYQQSEALLSGLKILSGVGKPDELFSDLLEVLRDVLEFEAAFVLISNDARKFRVSATTNEQFGDLVWAAEQLTERAMNAPVAVFDVARIYEWKQLPADVVQGVTSALHSGLKVENRYVLLVFTHSKRGFFGAKHAKIAEKFALLAGQAILDVELRQTLDEQNLFFRLSLEIMSIVDFDGSFRQANQAWQETFELQPDDLVGTNFFDLVSESHLQLARDAFDKAIGSENLVNHFKCSINTNAGVRMVAWRCTGVQGQNLVYLVGRDITEQHEMEKALVESRSAAEAANQAKSLFLAAMSHELRTPLNAILGTCEALQGGVYGELIEKTALAVGQISTAGEHQLELVNDLLDLTRIEAGGFEPSLEEFSLKELCESVVQMLRPRARNHGLHLNLISEGQIDRIVSDKRRVRQMILNLLGNAIKFTKEGGRVTLEFAVPIPGKDMLISVEDSGIGIPGNELERLFKPFTQVDSALSRKHSGTGLGLNLTSKLVQSLGGSIEVTSTVGKGSRFTLRLPYTVAPDSSVRAPVAPEAVEGGPKSNQLILLVDDNPANINHVRDYLIAKGHRVELAYSGAEALEKARTLPDLIFMDVQMPGMDGIEAIQRLRADSTTAGLKIISLTALATEQDRERCIQAGADDYLSKPISLKKLLSVVEEKN